MTMKNAYMEKYKTRKNYISREVFVFMSFSYIRMTRNCIGTFRRIEEKTYWNITYFQPHVHCMIQVLHIWCYTFLTFSILWTPFQIRIDFTTPSHNLNNAYCPSTYKIKLGYWDIVGLCSLINCLSSKDHGN